MASPRITAEQRALFDRSLREGNAITVSARRAQVSVGWAHKYIKAQRQRGIDPVAQFKIKPLPLGWSKLNEDAKRAWDDFPYFRLRYMGHPSEPWEVEAAETIVTALATEHREFIVESVAPGVGKTTMLHDVAAWATVRDRSIRGVFGSKNASNARRMMRRLRRTLERTSLVRARPEDLARGMAFDGVASLAGDYGLFRPVQSKYIEKDVWNNDEFVVVQDDDTPIDEKESTWTAFGIKSDILSMRYNLMLCDDMDDATTISTMDQLETQRKKWDSEVETRLEPRGVIALVQQSLDPQDLARYNLSKKLPLDPESYDDIDDEEAAAVAADTPSMYQHIIYKAHDDTKCQGKLTHKADAPAWPVGCLLSPKRLPWRDLYRVKMTKPRTYAVEYQQEEIDPKQTLVRKAWIYGGTDIDEETGMRFQAPGCVDNTRGICDLPADLVGPFYSIATVDPSPSKMWACLAEGTLVTTARGEVPIETVRPADVVMTRGGWRHVQHCTLMGTKPTVELHLSNGRTLRLTADHRVLTQNLGWVEAGSLSPNAALVTPPQVRRTSHVLHVSNIGQVVGIDTQGDPASVVDLSDDSATGEEDVRDSMRELLTDVSGRFESDHAVRATTVGAGHTSATPYPAAVGVLDRVRTKVGLVGNHDAAVVERAVAAHGANFGLGATGISARTTVHVGSITTGADVPVYDIGVADPVFQEFTAEGVIVHNCQWWIFAPNAGNQVFLMDSFKSAMGGNELLDYDPNARTWYGLMQDWQRRSVELGHPIQHWIVEVNAAQKFLLQYRWNEMWRAAWGVNITAHTTGINKLDPKMGVDIVRDWFKYGRIRLPFAGPAKFTSMRLIDEVCRYRFDGSNGTDDQVMACWFLFANLPALSVPPSIDEYQARPSYAASLDARRYLTAVS